MPILFLMSGGRPKTEPYVIGEEPLVVGRGTGVDLRVPDDALSRRHFLVLREGQGYVVEDLNSSNGTWVGGRRVLAARLRNNDCILAGHTRFVFRECHPVATRGRPRTAGPHGTVVLTTPAESKHGPAPVA